jgi:hypothetical protein
MDIMSFLGGLKWEFLKQKLLQAWISPNDIQWVDFNNMNDLNSLAEKIMPNIIKSNPNIASMLKSNASLLWEKQAEVVEKLDTATKIV